MIWVALLAAAGCVGAGLFVGWPDLADWAKRRR